jgi:predicted flap endonuclease-1-like 5' DNA nuclease
MAFRMRWPTEYGKITQEFGARPEFYQKFGLPGHEGLDFMAPEGSELYAVADGFVSDVRLDGNSDPNGKPYGNQIRIQHEGGFTSIYAHLSEVVVTRGQFVQAGQLIGLAGNTGNSFGAHLHFTLKKQGATQSDATNYPHDIIDPTPYLKPFGGSKPEQPSPPTETTIDVQVDSPEVGYLNVRSAPYVGSDLVTKVDHGETLGALEEADIAHSKVGKNGQWLWVRTPTGKTGYVAAWYIKLPPPEPAPGKEAEITFVKVDSPEVPLKLRSGPGIGYAQIDQMPDGATLKALEPPAEVRRKIGQHGAWLQVKTPAGKEGYTAAWYLKLEKTSAPAIPTPATGKPTKYVQVESPEFGLRVRGGPSTDHDQVWWIPHGTMLTSLEDERTTGRKVGQEDEWLHVRTPALWEGYVAAWYLKAPEGEDQRQPATQMDLRTGLSPHIQGIHAVTLGDDLRTRDPIRSLFESRNKKGWVFFTEVCGRQPQHVHLNGDLRNRLWDWADQGYGVIVRLNNGYEPNGTLPEHQYYDDFAAAAARWVNLYLKRPDRSQSEYTWTIQIANEQNNPREHPGGFEHPREHITAEMYAEAFNKTYAQIKAVLPNAIVCTGAVDPYNYMPLKLLGNAHWRPLDYYTTMLDHIDALDGIILHAYLHGPDPKRVTGLDKFGNGSGPLGDHYFDFQIYRLFMERIPGKWKDVPVYITEMNHICRPPAAPTCNDPNAMGWVNQNLGIVQEIFKEIDRWNQRPYAQQIRCGLLYRWMGDAWSLHDRPGILDDFKQSLDYDYRWRTTQAGAADFSFSAMAAEPEIEEMPEEMERTIVHPDDLTRIWGLGRKSELVLNTLGIQIFEQLAHYEPEQLDALIAETGLRTRHMETWPEQARLIVEGKKDDLLKMQIEMGKTPPNE